ncbi:fibronectin type III domain-containing protein [Blastococcus sp. Marseille-P5729]|uniref:fibronectin type III domain-containing protein n=1 Tax=Blastococcus sp. Marseille-P5729 TaxID=2086582 RepID=UPI000D103518|nr:fibronectin type III domain-containing protein [Blastococcus sp. Marseille-P5729]
MSRYSKAIATAAAGALIALSAAIPASAAAPATGDIQAVSLHVGEDETQRNLAWFSDSPAPEVVMLAPTSQMEGDEFPADARVIQEVESGPVVSKLGYFYHHATIDALAPDTEYTYQLGNEQGWSQNYTFRTGAGSGDFDFIFVGDPQMGTSGDLVTETAQWQTTLDSAWAMYPDAQLLLSAGDQVDRVVFASDDEYTAFKAPEQLTQYPLATTLGNHDVIQLAYGDHFYLPGHDGSSGFLGGHYHYTYNDVLFVHLNANDLRHQTLVDYTAQTMAEHPAQWAVVTFHHSIYSVAPHATDPDAEGFGTIEGRRDVLSKGMSELGVDLVLQGHDHYYTRTPLMNRGVPVNGPDEDVTSGPDFLAPKAGDVLYITGNSASGSKYYGRNDDLPMPAPWSEVENQEKVANFSRVRVTQCALTVSTYRSNDRTLVDEVELSGDTISPELSGTDPVTITEGDQLDPMAGVSAADDCGPATVAVDGVVDTATPGQYLLTYTATDRSGNAVNAERLVTVLAQETTSPQPSAPASPTDSPSSEAPGPTPGSSAAPAPGTWAPQAATSVTAAGKGDPRSKEPLAVTGSPLSALGIFALAAIAGGSVLVLRNRRS